MLPPVLEMAPVLAPMAPEAAAVMASEMATAMLRAWLAVVMTSQPRVTLWQVELAMASQKRRRPPKAKPMVISSKPTPKGKLVVPTGPIESVAVTGEQAGSIYVENHKGYEIYYYNQSGAEQYASMLNTVRSVLPDNVTIYDLLAPTSFAVELDKNLQEELGSSNMADAFNYIYSMMDPKIKRFPCMIYSAHIKMTTSTTIRIIIGRD